MKTLKIYGIAGWIVLAIFAFDYSLSLLTAADDFLNVIGVFILITIIIISIKIYKLITKKNDTGTKTTSL